MANTCISTFRVVGPEGALRRLMALLDALAAEGREGRALWRLAEAVFEGAAVPEEVDGRGFWMCPVRVEDYVEVSTESAWVPPVALWDAVARFVGATEVYFCGEDAACDVLMRRPCVQRGWFVEEVLVSGLLPNGEEVYEWFGSVNEALAWVSRQTATVVDTPEDVYYIDGAELSILVNGELRMEN